MTLLPALRGFDRQRTRIPLILIKKHKEIMFQPGNLANPTGRPKGAVSKKVAFERFLFEVFDNNKGKAELLLNAMFDDRRDFKWLMELLCARMPIEKVLSGEMTHTERKIIIEVEANGRKDNTQAVPSEVLPE